MSKSIQRGFTLIELVVVIVILGILAAFAVPRFMGLENEARVATVHSLLGSMKGTAAMAHGMCMAQGCANGASITVPGGQPMTMRFGYPDNASIVHGMEGLEGFSISNTRRFTRSGSRSANCWIQYNQAPNANTPPTYQYAQGVIGAGTPAKTEADMLAYLRTVC
jgi:MSHA pilin protein MshA